MAITPVRNRIPPQYISARRRKFAKFIVFIFLAVQAVSVPQPMQTDEHSANSAQEMKEVHELGLGKSIKRELAGGQKHFYQVAIAAGQYLKIMVEQRGIDVVVTLIGPDGKQLREVDSPNGTHGPEPVSGIFETAGVYRLEVYSLEKDAAPGRYEINVIELRDATEQDRLLEEAVRLLNESRSLQAKGMYAQGIPLAEQALAIREKTLRPDDPDIAIALHHLAVMSIQSSGNYSRAEPLFQRALSINEKVFGPENIKTADSLYSLALLYDLRGDFAQAEPLFYRALGIQERILGPDHPNLANLLDSLSGLYETKGDLAQAELSLKRSLAILEKALGTDHSSITPTLSNLGGFYFRRGNYSQAKQLLQRSMSIDEKVRGPNHPYTITTLTQLARCYQAENNYEQAEALYQRALDATEKTLGPDHPDCAATLTLLARVHEAKANYGQAEIYCRRAAAIFEKTLGTSHQAFAGSLINLARVLQEKREIQEAISLLKRASEIRELNISRNLISGSERQKLLYLSNFLEETNHFISLHARIAPGNSLALELAVTTLLSRKGRGLDAMADTISTLRLRAGPSDQALFDDLITARTQLANFAIGERGMNSGESEKTVKQIEQRIEDIEARISSRNAEFRFQMQPVTLEAVRSAIPAGTALVEFSSYRPFNPKDKKWDAEHYIAYVLLPQNAPRWVELGKTSAVNNAVRQWRSALGRHSGTIAKRQARKLDEIIMRPVRKLLGATRRLLLAPDGDLNLIPFAALVDENNDYLVENYSISYLTSGRDLLRLQAARESKSDPLVLANPTYGESVMEKAPYGRSGTSSTGIPLYFSPTLTADEAKAIGGMAPDAKLLMEWDATEARLKQANAPRFLHIATHGFFLKDAEPVPENTRSASLFGAGGAMSDPAVNAWAARIGNPLLRSGLALAGANQRKSGDDDGVLTALEAAGLNLWGTKLVVLSACDTGVGEVKNGDGVYGLRRALVLAGSESQVMSLWKVKDDATRDLMIDYYTELIKRKAGRGEALRQVQLRMLRNPKRRHPYFWAGFIQSGEWANLDGQR